jgi:hypothetical protein
MILASFNGTGFMTFNYGEPAELFLTKGVKRGHRKYHRFATAAEAIQFAIENIPVRGALDATMQVGDQRFDREEIKKLYDGLQSD